MGKYYFMPTQNNENNINDCAGSAKSTSLLRNETYCDIYDVILTVGFGSFCIHKIRTFPEGQRFL